MEFEVPVSHGCVQDGLVDCVWCAEGFTNSREYKHCSLPWYIKNTKQPIEHPCTNFEKLNKLQECLDETLECPWRSKGVNKDNAKRIICFEIKISLGDFKSGHGHNFCGNLNYYVIPKDLLPKVQDLVPENIGIIVYMENSDRLSITKECTYQDIPEEDYNWFLLSCVNKRLNRIEKEHNALIYAARDFRGLCNSMLMRLEIIKQAHPELDDLFLDNFIWCFNTYDDALHKALKEGDDILG